MRTIKTGDIVRLETLINSNKVNNETMINVFYNDGVNMDQGHWFEDIILEHSEKFGRVSFKPNNNVVFNII